MDDYITFRRDRCSRGGGLFICVKNYIDCSVLWTDEVLKMKVVEVKGGNPNFSWEVVGGLQSSKREHASYRKISSPDWVYRKLY